MPNRKLDAATEQQAIASAQWLIGIRGGLSHKHTRDYWRLSTKAELRGPVETDERFLQGIKNALGKKNGQVSVGFLPGPMKWNEKLAAKLIANAEQGNADADQVLREVAAECLERGELPPQPLADYAATCLRAAAGRKKARQQPNSSKPQSHKTNYRDWILALTVDDIVRHFKLNPALRHFKLKHTRNDVTEEHCACSIVAPATKPKLSERTVEDAWRRYQDIADQRTATNYIAQAMVFLISDPTPAYLMRFPRVGSPEATPPPKRPRARKA